MHLGGESQLGMCCKVCGRNSPDGKRGAGRIKGLEGGKAQMSTCRSCRALVGMDIVTERPEQMSVFSLAGTVW